MHRLIAYLEEYTFKNIAKTAFVIMNSLVDVSDSGQSPRGPATPWSPVRVNRRRSNPSPVTPPSSDPTSQHTQLAVADNRVDATPLLIPFLSCFLQLHIIFVAVPRKISNHCNSAPLRNGITQIVSKNV